MQHVQSNRKPLDFLVSVCLCLLLTVLSCSHSEQVFVQWGLSDRIQLRMGQQHILLLLTCVGVLLQSGKFLK